MVAPLVLGIGAGIFFGVGAILAAWKSPLKLDEAIRTKKGNRVRILRSNRAASDGCRLVAAVHCGGQTGEVINVYTEEGVFGGTLWTLAEYRDGILDNPGERDLSNLVNTATAIPKPLAPRAADGASSTARSPLNVSARLKTGLGNVVWILTGNRVDAAGNRIVALVPILCLHHGPDGHVTSTLEQVVNVYNRYGDFAGTVIPEKDAARGKEYLHSVEFVTRNDMTDLVYAGVDFKLS
jgi:hypothetical protein